MSKISGANVRRLLELFFLKSRLKVCSFALVRDHRPCFYLHCLRFRLEELLATTHHRP